MARKRLAVPTARAGASSGRQRLFECLRLRQCPARPSNVDACATRWPSSPPISGIRSEASPHRHPIRQRRSSSRSASGPSLRRHGHVFPRREFNGPEAEGATDASGARALLLLSPSLCIQHWAATTWSASSAPRLRALPPLRAGAGAACSSHRPPSQRVGSSGGSLQWIARCSPPTAFYWPRGPAGAGAAPVSRRPRPPDLSLEGALPQPHSRLQFAVCKASGNAHSTFVGVRCNAASSGLRCSASYWGVWGRLAAAGSRLRTAATAAATAPLLTELCNAQQLAGPGAARLQPFSTSPRCATGIRAHSSGVRWVPAERGDRDEAGEPVSIV